jgi:hypothetical protein
MHVQLGTGARMYSWQQMHACFCLTQTPPSQQPVRFCWDPAAGPDAIKQQTHGAFGVNNATGPGHVSIDSWHTGLNGL